MDWNSLLLIGLFLFAALCLVGVASVVAADWEQDEKERKEK